jgi:hypothetical protein
LEFSNKYIDYKKNLERAYFDSSLDIDILKKYINNMISEIKAKNELLSLNDIIQLFKLDNNYFQKLSKSLVLRLLDDEIKISLTPSRIFPLKVKGRL